MEFLGVGIAKECSRADATAQPVDHTEPFYEPYQNKHDLERTTRVICPGMGGQADTVMAAYGEEASTEEGDAPREGV
jgi:hypothetical protein